MSLRPPTEALMSHTVVSATLCVTVTDVGASENSGFLLLSQVS